MTEPKKEMSHEYRTLLAVILCLAVLIGFSFLNKPQTAAAVHAISNRRNSDNIKFSIARTTNAIDSLSRCNSSAGKYRLANYRNFIRAILVNSRARRNCGAHYRRRKRCLSR